MPATLVAPAAAGDGRVHVVLRGAGAIASIDATEPRLIERRSVCPAPRGITWDAERDLLHVACADGELSSLSPAGGPPSHTASIVPDLRDVVVGDGALYVSRFRSAELLTIDPTTGAVLDRRTPLSPPGFQPNTAWAAMTGTSGTSTGIGPRRTPSLYGGLLATAPFHWSGDQPDMSAVVESTLVERMGADRVTSADVAAIAAWLDRLPAPPGAVADADAVERGRALFEDESVGCASCHAGEAPTNDENADVGFGSAFQVPSLRGVLYRAPYFHSGCAPSLDAVVAGACGTLDQHGHTSELDASQRADLVAYLRAL